MVGAGQTAFPRAEPLDSCSNTKWSVLKLTSNILWTKQAVFLLYVGILCPPHLIKEKEVINLRESKGVHGRGWRDDSEGGNGMIVF